MTRPLYEAKADFFRTLGHPARIRVLELLSERDHAVHELLAEITIEPSTEMIRIINGKNDDKSILKISSRAKLKNR